MFVETTKSREISLILSGDFLTCSRSDSFSRLRNKISVTIYFDYKYSSSSKHQAQSSPRSIDFISGCVVS